jgi:hypothetical protein
MLWTSLLPAPSQDGLWCPAWPMKKEEKEEVKLQFVEELGS